MTKHFCKQCGKKMLKAYVAKLGSMKQIGYFCQRCHRLVLQSKKELKAKKPAKPATVEGGNILRSL